MKKISYDEKDISDILNIFAKNEVKLEFTTKDQLIQTIVGVAKRVEKIALHSRFFNTRVVKLLEYDVEDMHVISTGIGYPIRFFDYCPYDNVFAQIDTILEMFSFYKSPVLDFMTNFGVMYRGNSEEKYEGSYFWVNQNIMRDVLESDWEKFLTLLQLTTNHIDFICQNYSDVVLAYIGFDSKNKLSKCAFGIPTSNFFNRNPKKYYQNYVLIDGVLDLLSDIPDIEGISLQLSPNDSKYFSLEEDVYIENFNTRLKQIRDRDIIDEETYQRILNYQFPDTTHFIFKYRWSDENSFNFKVYTEKVY